MQTLCLNKKNETKEINLSRKDVLAKFQLHNRDLRPIFLSNQVSTILVREDSLIVNLQRIKLIISKDTVFIFNPKYREVSKDFVQKLQKNIETIGKDNSKYFAFVVLETALSHICDVVNTKFEKIDDDSQTLLKKLNIDTSKENLEKLLAIKHHLAHIETLSSEIQDLLAEIIEDEEDLKDIHLHLSEKQRQSDINTDEIESIFDNSLEIIEDILHKIIVLKAHIDSTQEIITLKLASLRNNIIRIDLVITLFGTMMSLGAFVVGIFGMNLLSHLEENTSAFYVVLFVLVLLLGAVFGLTYRYFKQKRIL